MSLLATELRSAPADDSDAGVLRVLRELEQAGITYCVLRGSDQIQHPVEDDEVDLLVMPQQLPSLRSVLERLGFVCLNSWGHAPHHFFVVYDDVADRWLKMDVVTQIAYGRPIHTLTTQLAEGCLKNRRRSGSVFIPSAEDELVALLLHCIVDKGEFPSKWQHRLAVLSEQIGDEVYFTEILAKCWPPEFTGRKLRTMIQEKHWDGLLANRPAVERQLAVTNPVGTTTRTIRDHLLRKLNRLVRLVRPQALSVAILAPDGAGKSTLAAGICGHFFFPVTQIYMGLYQKRGGTKSGRRLPGFGLFGKVVTQWRRYLRAHFFKARGRFVIFDRYTYDALLPSKSTLTFWQKLRRWLLAHACPAPDLIVVLDAPGELLFARKGEHSPEYLEQHRQAYLRLQHHFPQLIIVDATRDTDRVRREVVSHMWRGFADRVRGN